MFYFLEKLTVGLFDSGRFKKFDLENDFCTIIHSLPSVMTPFVLDHVLANGKIAYREKV